MIGIICSRIPENYYLTVDKATITQDGDGAQGQVEGECHIQLHEQGVRYRQVDCELYDRRAGLGFSFRLTNISETTHKQF